MVHLTLPVLLKEQTGGKTNGGPSPSHGRGAGHGYLTPNRSVDQGSACGRSGSPGLSSHRSPGPHDQSCSPAPRIEQSCSAGTHIDGFLCPKPLPREFFVNVVLDGEDRSQHAAAAAKEHGRSKLGRVGSLLGGVMGTMMGGSAVFDHAIAQSVKEAVVEKVLEALKRQRWWAIVVPMLLPPMPGKSEWLSYVSLGEKGHFMAFRVFVVGKLPGEDSMHTTGGSLLALLSACFSSCCAPELPPEDPDRKIAREIGLIQPEIQYALKERKHPINAHITLMDAAEEFHVLHGMNWSRELCAEAVVASRSTNGRPVSVA